MIVIPHPYDSYRYKIVKQSNKSHSKVKSAVDSVFATNAGTALKMVATAAAVTAIVVVVIVGAVSITFAVAVAAVIAQLLIPVVTIAIVIAVCAILFKLI